MRCGISGIGSDSVSYHDQEFVALAIAKLGNLCERSMRYEKWKREFQPIPNHLTANTAIDGCVFLPQGPDFEYVRRQPKLRVWSFIVCEDARKPVWLISEGFHFVNLMGYLVTRKEFDPTKIYDVRY